MTVMETLDDFESAVTHARVTGSVGCTYNEVTATSVAALTEGTHMHLGGPHGPVVRITGTELDRDEYGLPDRAAVATIRTTDSLGTQREHQLPAREFVRTTEAPLTILPPAAPRIEVLTLRDPDSATDVRIFVDGTEIEFSSETIDAGAGHTRADWDEHTETVRTTASYSPAFRDAVLDLRDDPPGAEHITG